MKILIDIPKEVSKELKIFKAKEEFDNQEEAVVFILNEKFFGVEEDGRK